MHLYAEGTGEGEIPFLTISDTSQTGE
jgi:hypothetical protein